MLIETEVQPVKIEINKPSNDEPWKDNDGGFTAITR
jgi:hypothetical protein